VTDTLDCVIADVGDSHDAFSATAARRILAETEW